MFKVCVEVAYLYGGAGNQASLNILNSPGNRARRRLAKKLARAQQTNKTHEEPRNDPQLSSRCLSCGSCLPCKTDHGSSGDRPFSTRDETHANSLRPMQPSRKRTK